MKRFFHLVVAVAFMFSSVPVASAVSFNDLTNYQKQKYWSVMSSDCIPLLKAKNYKDYRTCALNALELAKNYQENYSWCTDSDNGSNYLQKGIVKTDIKPNGIADYIYTFPNGKTYLMEGMCSSQHKYYYIQKNCSELGSKYHPDTAAGACVYINNAPVFEESWDGSESEIEIGYGNNNLTIAVGATDADGDELTFYAENLPDGATFRKGIPSGGPLSEGVQYGILDFNPQTNQVGQYGVTLFVSDGLKTDNISISIVVTNSKAEELSKLVCEIDPITGKTVNCVCDVNQDKNNFAVIVKKGGVLDNDTMSQKLNLFLSSIESDLGFGNANVKYFDGDSISELDNFIENLYYNEDVAYVTIIGNEFDLLSNDVLSTDLSLVGKASHLPEDGQGLKGINPDAYCREVTISWILSPSLYSDEEQIDFISKVLDTYTAYHNNENNILDQYRDDYLRIQWENGHTNLGSDLIMYELGYDKNEVLAWNHEYDKVKTELANKHYLLYYNVHGSPMVTGMGLNPSDETTELDAVYTSLDEFSEFAEQYGTPALLVNPHSCGSMVIEYNGNKNCCWPQRMMGAGVWAYYNIYAMYNNAFEKSLSTDSFFGHTIRNNPVGLQYFIFGDITARFKK